MSQTGVCTWQLSQLDPSRPETVDGDRGPRPGGTVAVDGVGEDGDGAAVDIRVVAPPPEAREDGDAPAGPDHGPGEPDTAGRASDGADAAERAADTADTAERAADTAARASDATDTADPTDTADTAERAAVGSAGEAADEPASGVPGAGPGGASDRGGSTVVVRPRRACVRRGLVAAVMALVVALAVSAFATAAPTPANVDQGFVDAARSQGYVAAPDQQALVVSAARKICERRERHSTAAERRATALSSAELGAVQQTFADDVRVFTTLALDTYCPS